MAKIRKFESGGISTTTGKFIIDGIGEFDPDEVHAGLFNNADQLYQQTGMNDKYRSKAFDRALEIINLTKQQGMNVSANGKFTFTKPLSDNTNYTSDGKYHRSLFGIGPIKNEDNTINNIAYNLIYNQLQNKNSSNPYKLKSVAQSNPEEYDALVKSYYKNAYIGDSNNQTQSDNQYEGVDWNNLIDVTRGSMELSDFIKNTDTSSRINYIKDWARRGIDEIDSKDWKKNKWNWVAFKDASSYRSALENLSTFAGNPNLTWDTVNDENNRVFRQALIAANAEELEMLFNPNYKRQVTQEQNNNSSQPEYTFWERNKVFNSQPDKWEEATRLNGGRKVLPAFNNKENRWEYFNTDENGNPISKLNAAENIDWGWENPGYYAYDGVIYNDDGKSLGTVEPDFISKLNSRTGGLPKLDASFNYSSEDFSNDILDKLDNPNYLTRDGLNYGIYGNWTNKIKNLNGTLIGIYDNEGTSKPSRFALKRGNNYIYGRVKKDEQSNKLELISDDGTITQLGEYNPEGNITSFSGSTKSYKYVPGTVPTVENQNEFNESLYNQKWKYRDFTDLVDNGYFNLNPYNIGNQEIFYIKPDGTRHPFIGNGYGNNVERVMENGSQVSYKGDRNIALVRIKNKNTYVYAWMVVDGDNRGQIVGIPSNDYISGKNNRTLNMNIYNPIDKKENGGILKFQQGGISSWEDYANVVKQNRTAKESANKSREKDEIGEKYDLHGMARFDQDLTTADWMEIGALATDVVSTVAGFVPGAHFGAMAAGMAASGTQFAADIKRDGLDWGDAGSLAVNLGLDAASFIPGLKALKGAKAAVKMAKWIPRVINIAKGTAVAAASPQILQGLSNLQRAAVNGDLSKTTARDWQALLSVVNLAIRPAVSKGANMLGNINKSGSISKTKVNEVEINIKGNDGNTSIKKINIGDDEALKKFNRLSPTAKKSEIERLALAQLNINGNSNIKSEDLIIPDASRNIFTKNRGDNVFNRLRKRYPIENRIETKILDSNSSPFMFDNSFTRWGKRMEDADFRNSKNNNTSNISNNISQNLKIQQNNFRKALMPHQRNFVVDLDGNIIINKDGGILKFQQGSISNWKKLGTPINSGGRQNALFTYFSEPDDIENLYTQWSTSNPGKGINDFAKAFNSLQSSYNTNVFDPSNQLQTKGYSSNNVGQHQNLFHGFANDLDTHFRNTFLNKNKSVKESEINNNSPLIADNVVGSVTEQRYLDNPEAVNNFNKWLNGRGFEYRLANENDSDFTRSNFGNVGAQYGIFPLQNQTQLIADKPIATPNNQQLSGKSGNNINPQQLSGKSGNNINPQQTRRWDPTPFMQFGAAATAIAGNNSVNPFTYSPENPWRHDGRITGDLATKSAYQRSGAEKVRAMNNVQTSDGSRRLAGILEAYRLKGQDDLAGNMANSQRVKETQYIADQYAARNSQIENDVANRNIRGVNQVRNQNTSIDNDRKLANARVIQGLFNDFKNQFSRDRDLWRQQQYSNAQNQFDLSRQLGEQNAAMFQNSIGQRLNILSHAMQNENLTPEAREKAAGEYNRIQNESFGSIGVNGEFIPGVINQILNNNLTNSLNNYQNSIDNIPYTYSWAKRNTPTYLKKDGGKIILKKK